MVIAHYTCWLSNRVWIQWNSQRTITLNRCCSCVIIRKERMAAATNNNKSNETSPDIVKLRACACVCTCACAYCVHELCCLIAEVKIRESERWLFDLVSSIKYQKWKQRIIYCTYTYLKNSYPSPYTFRLKVICENRKFFMRNATKRRWRQQIQRTHTNSNTESRQWIWNSKLKNY